MQWLIGKLIALLLRLTAAFIGLYMFALRATERTGIGVGLTGSETDDKPSVSASSIYMRALRMLSRIGCGLDKIQREIRRLRNEVGRVAVDLAASSAAQCNRNPLDPAKKTIFITITCGQAVRNFLLSDAFDFLVEQYNVVIFSPFAYSEGFRRTYGRRGVHILPWFESFRSAAERVFLYYFMRKSGSRTHQGWLTNLETRAKTATEQRSRFAKHHVLLRISETLGSVFGRRGIQALYHSYFLSYLPKSMFRQLFSTYKPALVLSTTAHHVEAWPLTYFGRRYGCKAVANILSWDNTSTKPAMDRSCNYYTVWSNEMKEEFARHHPYVNARLIVTGSPLFDMYYDRRGATDRTTFLTGLGLSPHRPYVLWTTNTPAGMPDEHEIIRLFWEELDRSPLAGKISLLVRLHPKDDQDRYVLLRGLDHVAITYAASPYWQSSDRWLPNRDDMGLLLNSMLHAAVSVNVASTMSLESFALSLPTINVAFKFRDVLKDHNLMWSFDMYHTSEHYRAIVDNAAVSLARNMNELLEQTISALEHPESRQMAMRRTLEQKAAHCDGTSARHFVAAISDILEAEEDFAFLGSTPSTIPYSARVASISASQRESAASSCIRLDIG